MKAYQEKQGIVNTGIEITHYEILQEKAKDGLLKLSMSLGIEVMRMIFEEDVTMYAGPKGKHGTAERIGYRHGSDQTTVVMEIVPYTVENDCVTTDTTPLFYKSVGSPSANKHFVGREWPT